MSAVDLLVDLAKDAVRIRAIQPPKYDNANLHSFALWYIANLPALERHWQALGEAIDADPDDTTDFFLFAACQHEQQL